MHLSDITFLTTTISINNFKYINNNNNNNIRVESEYKKNYKK